MSKPIDYSKWNNIELSDDDCENLPHTIDQKSFQRFQKSKRRQRDVTEDQEKRQLREALEKARDQLAQLGSAGRNHAAGQVLQAKIGDLTAQLAKLERSKHWNADNMCKTAEDRSIVISQGVEDRERVAEPAVAATAEQPLLAYSEFTTAHEAVLEAYIAKASGPIEHSRGILEEHGCLLAEHAETYFLLDCLEKEMNGKHEEMVLAARQAQLVTNIRQLIAPTGRPMRDGVALVLDRLEREGLGESFQAGVDAFVKKIEERAVTKKQELDAEAVARKEAGGRDTDEEEEEEIDPEVQKVLDMLPQSMLDAFQNQDIEALHLAVARLPPDLGKHYMRKCEEVGLWNRGDGEDPPYTH